MWTKPIREINHLVKLGRQLETENGQMLLWPLSGAEIQIQCKEMYVELEGLGDGQASWVCVWADGAVIARPDSSEPISRATLQSPISPLVRSCS